MGGLLFKCPKCGGDVEVQVTVTPMTTGPGWEPIGRRMYAADALTPWSGGETTTLPPWPADAQEWERKAPARAASLESDVWVPAAQALVSGGVGALVGGGVCVLVGWPWYVALAGGVFVLAGVWAWRLTAHTKLLWLVDWVSRAAAPAPQPQSQPKPDPLRIEVTTDKRKIHILELPGVTERQLRLFARSVMAGQTMAVNSWTGGGKPFSRPQFDVMMTELVRAGLVVDRGGSVGRVLTDAGRQAFGQIAKDDRYY